MEINKKNYTKYELNIKTTHINQPIKWIVINLLIIQNHMSHAKEFMYITYLYDINITMFLNAYLYMKVSSYTMNAYLYMYITFIYDMIYIYILNA